MRPAALTVASLLLLGTGSPPLSAQPPIPPPLPQARLDIATTPPSKVWLEEGIPPRTTPFVTNMSPPGTHKIHLEQGGKAWSLEVDFPAWHLVTVRCHLPECTITTKRIGM